MQLSLEHIEKELLEAGDTVIPGRLANYRLYLSAIHSLRAGEMQRILAAKPGIWNLMRQGQNSDKATEREWQATEMGLRELQLKWEIKRISVISSAIATKLRVAEIEARNIV
jgi:outer membrane protease